MFSKIVRLSNSAANWNEKPIERRKSIKSRGDNVEMSTSWTMTRPLSGLRRPLRSRRIVDFPRAREADHAGDRVFDDFERAMMEDDLLAEAQAHVLQPGQ